MERWVVWQRYNIPPVIRVRFPPLPSLSGRPAYSASQTTLRARL